MINSVQSSPENVSIDTTSIRQREHLIARKARLKGLGEPLGLGAALLVLIVIFSFINPRFATVANLQNILDQTSLPLIIAVGATLVILLGSIDLSVEGVMGAAGMAWILLTANSRGGIDLGPAAWLVGIGVGMGLGLVTGLIHTRVKVPSFIVSLGMWYVGLGLATIMYGTDVIPRISDNGVSIWSTQAPLILPNSFFLAAAVVVIGAALVRFTRLGRVTLAIGNNEAVALENGLPVDRIKITVFVIAGLLSGLAGILATMKLGAGSPTVGSGLLFVVIPAVVIGGTSLGGGRGGVLKTTLGVFLLTVLNNGLVVSGVDASFQSAVSGAILIVAITIAAWSQRDRLRIAK